MKKTLMRMVLLIAFAFSVVVVLPSKMAVADCEIECTYGNSEVLFLIEGDVICYGNIMESYAWYYHDGYASYCYDYYVFDCSAGPVFSGGGGWTTYY